ncbi:chondroitinase-B domain-containing protein [Flavobacterium sp. NG2]|uniref:chondroitinase-B domain-containing protein n=1 Tax=Flavobacterium sp. NG2 TaxID=3097547 RepID=UPI002A83E990|nr:chondroitinase-B domain-containing protein [Flavobacterium sp. NG2]WPR71310.1 chondroitinase-B domain-containing protein [Flavobacterium sp. NG2]
MKNTILLLTVVFQLLTYGQNVNQKSILVKDIHELNKAINQVAPGHEIILANGIWSDVKINFYGLGTKEQPISLRAETPGKVFIEGISYLQLGGEYLIVDGLYFRNGHTPISGIIRYSIGQDKIANNCRVTQTVIDGFTQPNRLDTDQWIEFYGKNNQLDHCYITGKSNDGETLRVYLSGNENINNHHQIVQNYFGPRPRKGGPRAETIRVGASETSFAPSFTNVEDNYFEACNGEIEIISDKTNSNIYKNNIFYKCEGSLVLRHGDYATVDGNIFIGGDESNFYGGIRVVNSGHWITNNYFYKIKGDEFRCALAVMNGIFNTGLNRYKQVTDAVIAYNTWVDCKSPCQIGVGQNLKSADVLPASEIRSLAPERTIIANNIIYNTQEDAAPIINHSKMEGIQFHNNKIDNQGKAYTEFNVLVNSPIKMKKINDWLYTPDDSQNQALKEVYTGYEFNTIKKDLFGSSRLEKNSIGAISQSTTAEKFVINKKKYSPKWFTTDKVPAKVKTLTASSVEGDLAKKISQAASGDIILLTDKRYTLPSSIKIDKSITIRSKNAKNKAQIVFTGENETPAFEMNPKGNLKLENLVLKGGNGKYAFAPLHKNMSSAYNLKVENSTIEDFD